MPSDWDDVQQDREKRPYDLLACAEIIPVLPNFSTADLELIGSHEARHQALATVIRAADNLLAVPGEGTTANGPATMLLSGQQDPIDTPGEFGTQAATAEAQLWGPTGAWSDTEAPASSSATKARNRKAPAVIVAGLVILALVAVVGRAVVSGQSTHVAATKTATTLGALKEAPTVQPAAPGAAAPPTSENPGSAAPDDTVDAAVADFAVPPLPTSPPTTAVICPAGRVTAAISQVQAQQSASDPTGWDVSVIGTLTNGTATPIVAPSVNVTITTSGGQEPAYGDPNSSQLAPGQSANWNATSYVSSTTRPTATAQPGRWAWVDPKYAQCPSG